MDINKLLEKGSKTRRIRKDLITNLQEFESFVKEILIEYDLTDLDTLKKFDFRMREDQKDVEYVDDNRNECLLKSEYFGFRYCGSRHGETLQLVFIREKEYLRWKQSEIEQYLLDYRDYSRGELVYYHNEYSALYHVMTRNMTIDVANNLTAFIENFDKQLELMQDEETLNPEVLSNIKKSSNLKINK